ncbi:MAG TPA: glycosyltransferase, partial [Dehalococcoidia bacterium]|nr:glycosyltransferase [Dehalococcoidia bacterium]
SVKLLRYLVAGIPVIATAVGENSAMVRPDRSGYLVDPADPAGFARAIARMIADPARAAAFGAFGRQDVLARFRWSDHVVPLVVA